MDDPKYLKSLLSRAYWALSDLAARLPPEHNEWEVYKLMAEIHRALQMRDRPEPTEPLTDREEEVISLVAHGLRNKAIADRLGIAERTVSSHLGNIFGKLGLNNRTQLANYAFKRGMFYDERTDQGML